MDLEAKIIALEQEVKAYREQNKRMLLDRAKEVLIERYRISDAETLYLENAVLGVNVLPTDSFDSVIEKADTNYKAICEKYHVDMFSVGTAQEYIDRVQEEKNRKDSRADQLKGMLK